MSRKIIALLLFGLAFAGITPAVASLPTAPSDVSVTSTSPNGTALNEARAKVQWTSVNDAIGYIVRYKTGTETNTVVYVNSPSGNQVEVEDLVGGRSYTFTVSSYNASGERAASQITFTAVSVPKAPTVVSSEAGIGSITLKWSAAASDETGGSSITNYVLESDQGAVETVTATLTEKTVTGLARGSTHIFSIRAINRLGTSTKSTFEQAVVFDRPVAPTGVALAVSGRTLTTSWTAPTSDGGSTITGYKIFLISSATSSDVDSKTTEASTRNTEFTNVANGTYNVRVVATNGVGDSVRSTASPDQVVNVTVELTDNTPIFTPSGLTTLQVDGTVNLAVTAPSGESPTVTVSGAPANACTYAGGVLTGVVGGTCNIRAIVAASGNYGAGDTTLVVSIVKLTQSITFPTIGDKSAPGSVTLAATSSSGLQVTYSVSGNCSVSGSVVTTSGGSCTVTAVQAGNTRYAAATSQVQSFVVATGGGAGGGGGFAGGGVVVSGGAVSTPVVETKVSSVVVRFQVRERPPIGGFFAEEFCLQVQGILTTTLPVQRKCGSSQDIVDFTLGDGDYSLSLSDSKRARNNVSIRFSLEKGIVLLTGLDVLQDPVRYQLVIGERSPQASLPETSASTTPGAISADSPSVIAPQKEDAKGSSSNAENQLSDVKDSSEKVILRPKVKVIKSATSKLPRIEAVSLRTLTSARNVSRVSSFQNESKLSVPIARSIQFISLLTKKSNDVTITVKREGEKSIRLLSNSKATRGDLLSPIIQFKKTGEYRVTVIINGKKTTLNLKITKK